MGLKTTRTWIGDVKINVSCAGDPDADPILFLHGGGTYPPRYAKTLELLAQDHYVVAPHLDAAPLEQQADIASDVARSFIGHGYHLIGHSYGAAVALTLASLYLGPCDLIYANGPLQGPRSLIKLLIGGSEIAKRVSKERTTAELPHYTFQRMKEIVSYIGFPSRRNMAMLTDLQRFDPTKRHCGIPTLFLHTAHDEFFPITHTTRTAIAHQHPDARLRIVSKNGATLTHTWFYDQPEHVQKEVEQFYREEKR